MYRFFANQRYFKLFFDIDQKNITELSKNHGTMTHISNVTDQLVKELLIEKVRKGRETEVKVTKDGREFMEILRIFDNFVKKQTKKINKGGTND